MLRLCKVKRSQVSHSKVLNILDIALTFMKQTDYKHNYVSMTARFNQAENLQHISQH